MIGYLNNKRAQSMLEYAVLMVVIIGALIAMQTYFKRGIQGRMKSSADDVGDQFSPGNTNVIVTEKSFTNQTQTFGIDGQGVSKTEVAGGDANNDSTNTTSRSVIINTQRENWGGS